MNGNRERRQCWRFWEARQWERLPHCCWRQSGRTTREQLRGYARKAEDALREAANEAGQRLEEAVNEGKEYVDARKSVLREAFEAGREAMKREQTRGES